MRRSASFAAAVSLLAFHFAATCGVARGETLVPSGPLGSSPVYGYEPTKPHYGPIEAQRELDCLTYQPGVRGTDLGYGIGYFFGFGPPAQHGAAASTTHSSRKGGFIDARWSSGYARGDTHCECGRFTVRSGCGCLTPSQYRDFAPMVVPQGSHTAVGSSWYARESFGAYGLTPPVVLE